MPSFDFLNALYAPRNHYTFTDIAGGAPEVIDSAASLDGTIGGVVNAATGKWGGKAIDLVNADANSNSWVTFGSDTPPNDITVSLWLLTRDITHGSRLVTWKTLGGDYLSIYTQNNAGEYEMVVTVKDGANTIGTNTNVVEALASDTWIHIAYTHTGDEHAKIYVNGEYQAPGDGSAKAGGAPARSSLPMAFGKYGNQDTGAYLDGLMCDVRILSTVLTESEMQRLLWVKGAP